MQPLSAIACASQQINTAGSDGATNHITLNELNRFHQLIPPKAIAALSRWLKQAILVSAGKDEYSKYMCSAYQDPLLWIMQHQQVLLMGNLSSILALGVKLSVSELPAQKCRIIATQSYNAYQYCEHAIHTLSVFKNTPQTEMRLQSASDVFISVMLSSQEYFKVMEKVALSKCRKIPQRRSGFRRGACGIYSLANMPTKISATDKQSKVQGVLSGIAKPVWHFLQAARSRKDVTPENMSDKCWELDL